MVTKLTTLGVLAASLLLAPVFASGAQAFPATGGLGVKAPGLVTQVRDMGGGRGFAAGGAGIGRSFASPGGGMRAGSIGGGRAFSGPGRAYVGPGNIGRGAYVRPGGPGGKWAKGNMYNGPRVAGWRGYGYNKYNNKYRRFYAYPFLYGYPYYAAYGYGGYGGCYWLKQRALRTGDPYWWQRYRDCRNWD